MDNPEIPASNWRINDETPTTNCELCKQINPPIYEVVYQLRTCPMQYHYLCKPCSIKKIGKQIFEAGVQVIADRVAAAAETRRKGHLSRKASAVP